MGYISVIQIWNDELDRITADPKKWVEELVGLLGGLGKPGDRLPGAKVLRNEHASYDTLHLVGTGAASDGELAHDRWDSLRDQDLSREERAKAKQVRMLRKAAEKLGFTLVPTDGESPLLGLNAYEKQQMMEKAGFVFKPFVEEGRKGYVMVSPKAPFSRIAMIYRTKDRGPWTAHLDLRVVDEQIHIPPGGQFKTLREAKKAVYAHSDVILQDRMITDLNGLIQIAKKGKELAKVAKDLGL